MDDLVWITVPHRLLTDPPPSAEHLKRPAVVRVVVVPRLTGGDLTFYPRLADWPATLRGAAGSPAELRFSLFVKDDHGVRQTRIAPRLFEPVARSDVWNAVFRQAAASFGLRRGLIGDALEPNGQYTDARHITDNYREASADLAPDSGRAPADAERWIRQWQPTEAPSPSGPQPTPSSDPLDFTRTFALLREHPEVLRDLGLIFELLVEADELAGAPDRLLQIRSNALGTFVTSPWTRYVCDDSGFRPSSDPHRALRITTGMLDLGGVDRVDLVGDPEASEWAIATCDVDGGVAGLRAARTSLDAAHADRTARLPGLRSAGLALLRRDRSRDFSDRMSAARVRSDDTHVIADDLILGYRVDIETDGDWRSLCERTAEYVVTDAEGQMYEVAAGRDRVEEGHVKAFAAVRGEDGLLRCDDTVVRWNGWSLAVPRPTFFGSGADEIPTTSAGQTPAALSWQFGVPSGSLPALRFGSSYRMRVRIADIAGGGPTLDEVGDLGATNPIVYRRYEPVSPPLLTVESALLPGAAVDRVVVRSDRGIGADEFAAANSRYAGTDRCTLYAPTTTLEIAEQHGVFDDRGDEDAWALVLRAIDAVEGDPPARSLPDPAASGIAAYAQLADDIRMDAVTWGDWPAPGIKTAMVEDAGQSAAALRWADDALVIQLPQGGALDVQLSSQIDKRRLPEFAVYEWLAGMRGSSQTALSIAAASQGRHPLLSPPARIRAVHAVRKPLVDPLWTATVRQQQHATRAQVSAVFASDGLHTGSTGHLEIAAEWTEAIDERTVPMDLPDVHHQDVLATDGPTRCEFDHDFGDTKHRVVAYTAKAVTRFREFFFDDELEEDFEVRGRQEAIVVKSTQRPPAPSVLAVSPGFRWSTESSAQRIVRVRAGNRVVAELARPWNVTGPGERLAVVTASTVPPAGSAELVTRVARDPIYGAPSIAPYPPAEWLVGEPVDSTLPGSGLRVRIVPFDVTFAHDRWLADIAFAPPPGTNAYRPFLYLAVARYQPESLDGLDLSEVVTADPVPLLPERSIEIERVSSGISVRMTGIGPETPNRLHIGLDQWNGPRPVLDLIALDAAGEIPAWRPMPEFTAEGDASGPPLHLGLPATTASVRLRIRETESIPTASVAAAIGDPVPAELQDRTVLVDHVPIPPDWLSGSTT